MADGRASELPFTGVGERPVIQQTAVSERRHGTNTEPAAQAVGLAEATDAAKVPDVTVTPGGGSFTYKRTFTLNQATLSAIQNNKA